MSIKNSLDKNKFAVTVELAPVKGTDLSEVVEEAERIKSKVDGINVTDNQRAIMRSSPVAFSRLLVERGINPVCQLNCRDRNRLALQSDLLGMAILGIKDVLILTGDAISSGDHPHAKSVFDLDSVSLIAACKSLMAGRDLSGKEIKGRPDFFVGAAVNPGVNPVEMQVVQTVRKIEQGADFFQTQLIFDAGVVENFLEELEKEKVDLEKLNMLAGIFPLKSAKQALFFNSKIPGVKIPEHVVKRLQDAADPGMEGVEIAWDLVKSLKGTVKGVHLMAMGNNKALEILLDRINTEIVN